MPRPLRPSSRSRLVTLLACAAPIAVGLVVQASGCAQGNNEELGQQGGAGPGSTSSSTTSTTSGGGQGGAATTSTTSGGGQGGATSTTSGGGQGGTGGTGTGGTGGTGGSGGSGGSGGGGPTDTVLLFAGGSTSLLGAEYHPGAAWVTSPIAEQTMHGTAVALVDPAAGVALFRSSSTANAGQLMFATWSAGAWGSPMSIGGTVTTQNRPVIAAQPGKAHVVFHGNNFNHYYVGYDPMMVPPWSPPVEPIGPAGSPAFGPTPPVVGFFGGGPIAAYAGGNSDLYHHTRDAASWTSGYAHFNGMAPFVVDSPAIVTLSQGNEMMIAFLQDSDKRVYWTRGSGTTWTPPALLDTNALSNEPVALAAMPLGEAVMAYRGQNGQLYTSRYTPAAMPPWSTPAPLSNPNVSIPSPPALATGVGGALAEMAYVDEATGMAYHTRLMGNGWTTPALVGGSGLSFVAVATPP